MQNNFYKKIGKKIRDARNEIGLTLEELNERTGLNLSKGSFSSMENGKQQISIYQLHRIANALGVPLNSFFDELENESDFPASDKKIINEL